MAIIIEDTFTEASPPVLLQNHTPEDGGSWVKCPISIWQPASTYDARVDTIAMSGHGDLGVVKENTQGTSWAYYHSVNPGTGNIDIYWDFGVWDGYTWGAAASCRLAFRASIATTEDGYALEYDNYDPVGGPPPNHGIRFVRYDAGAKTELWAPSPEEWYSDYTIQKFKIEVRGSDIEVFHWEDPGGGEQWVSKWSGNDSTWASGHIVLTGNSANVATDYLKVETAESPPGTPTIAIDGQGPDYIELSSSTFSVGVPAYGQTGAQWQVTSAADTGFATPLIDVTTTNSDDFESFYASGGLNLFINQYIARVRHKDAGDRWSGWSAASSATALETSGQYYTAFAERPIGVNISTDTVADWSELDLSDGYSTWFLEERADATCQVTMDRVPVEASNPTSDTVDPITWEGFPSVATQIVLGRFVIDNITSQGTCASGVESPNGYVCREVYGLKSGPHYGGAGTGGINPAGTTAPYWSGTTTLGGFCQPIEMQMGGPAIGTPILSTDWAQVSVRRIFPDRYWSTLYPSIELGATTRTQGRLCGLYKSWGWVSVAWELTLPSIGLATPPDTAWQTFKAGADENGVAQSWMAWESHIGLEGEYRYGPRNGFGGGDWGVTFVDPCCYSCDGILSTHGSPSPCGVNIGDECGYAVDEFILCAGNRVRILDLPTGWTVKIGGTGPHVSTSEAFWPAPITGDGSDDQYIDFRGFAFPADTMYLSDSSGQLIDEWDVPTGIWGGDEYRINAGVLGAAGVGARLSGTFEGNDGTGYIAYIDAADGLKLDKWDATTGLTNLDTVSFPLVPGKYYNVVLETVGTTIRAKAWEGGAGLQGDPENNDPGTWMISVTDASYATGSPGLVGLTDQPVDFDAFAVGLGGDPYPTGRYPGACSWVSPTEGEIISQSPYTLQWNPPPVTQGVLGGEITYELEYQVQGESGWAPLATNIRTTTYSWNLDQLPAGYYCVRVRAYAGCEYGPWSQICLQWLLGISRVPEGYFFGDWYTGEPDVGMWIRLFRASHTDDGQPVPGCLVTREFLPAGVGGENLFQKLYLVVTTTTVGVLRVTPILDGEYIEQETRYIQTHTIDENDPNPSFGQRQTKRYEIDLTRGWSNPELWRYGLRGTYFQVEVCATDYGGTGGRIELDGVFVKYTVVRETHPWARPFYGELEVDVEHPFKSYFFFGTSTDDADASIWLAQEGTSDFGESLRAVIDTNKYAPFGEGNEGWFRTLYLSITRSNVSDLTIVVTPRLDNEQLEQQTFTLAATANPITEVIEVPLSVPLTVNSIEVGRSGARGVWFSFQIATSGNRPEGEIAVNGAALNAIPVRETQPGEV